MEGTYDKDQKSFLTESNKETDLLSTPCFPENEIDKYLVSTETSNIPSKLGYFSRPCRIMCSGEELIVKLYLPVRNFSLVNKIACNHDDYIDKLRSLGINVPGTKIFIRSLQNKYQLVIIQKSFKDSELLRNQFVNAPSQELKMLSNLVFSDTLKYWRNRSNESELGFHPTLRNYTLHDGKLYYFDTFPPMLMPQKELNRIIIKMSPFGGWLRKITPARLINRVSDEYYYIDKMFTGIVGSICRLRPEHADMILRYSNEYVKDSELLTPSEKEKILGLIDKPPQLTGIWILIRFLSGNKGKPNIRLLKDKPAE